MQRLAVMDVMLHAFILLGGVFLHIVQLYLRRIFLAERHYLTGLVEVAGD